MLVPDIYFCHYASLFQLRDMDLRYHLCFWILTCLDACPAGEQRELARYSVNLEEARRLGSKRVSKTSALPPGGTFSSAHPLNITVNSLLCATSHPLTHSLASSLIHSSSPPLIYSITCTNSATNSQRVFVFLCMCLCVRAHMFSNRLSCKDWAWELP